MTETHTSPAPSSSQQDKKTVIKDPSEINSGIILLPQLWLNEMLANSVRVAHDLITATLLIGCLAAVVVGAFRPTTAHMISNTSDALVLLVLTLLVLWRRTSWWPLRHPSEMGHSQIELGAMLVTISLVLVELSGGPTSVLSPLLFLTTVLISRLRGNQIIALSLLVGTLCGVSWWQSDDSLSVALTLIFIIVLFFLGRLFQTSSDPNVIITASVQEQLDQRFAQAQDFRLETRVNPIAALTSHSTVDQNRILSSVNAIRDSLYNALAVAERALKSHTVALLWLSDDGLELTIKELRSQSDFLSTTPIDSGEGVVGAIHKQLKPLTLNALKPDYSGLSYYRRPAEQVTDFAGVPVYDGDALRAILVADRTGNTPFIATDIAILETVAEEIIRVIHVERLLVSMERDKHQRDRFFKASHAFTIARTLSEVTHALSQAVYDVTHADFVAVCVDATPHHSATMELEIAQALKLGENIPKFIGKNFPADGGLVGASIKARHILPHSTKRADNQIVFSQSLEIYATDYIKIIPLLSKDQPVGALVVGGDRDYFLDGSLLDMLRAIGDHAAIAIDNAQIYEQMERMATTDGMTGLVNHRHFQTLFDDYLRRAERYNRPLSVILIDVDFFKSVNDTYGHPVGDKVLKTVAGLLAINARKGDVVARYGGEEFAILMEETPKEIAIQTANRIRQSIADEIFHSKKGQFSRTASFGIATFPADATDKPALTSAADQALYAAKEGGRNQVVTFSEHKNIPPVTTSPPVA